MNKGLKITLIAIGSAAALFGGWKLYQYLAKPTVPSAPAAMPPVTNSGPVVDINPIAVKRGS